MEGPIRGYLIWNGQIKSFGEIFRWTLGPPIPNQVLTFLERFKEILEPEILVIFLWRNRRSDLVSTLSIKKAKIWD